MKVSYNWLQKYFDESLPNPEKLGELLTFHAYELEEIQEIDGDHIIDVDILPNRSSDSLSHRGIARELSTILDTPLKEDPLLTEIAKASGSEKCKVSVDDYASCSRYTITLIEGVTVGPSPDWLKATLEALGQRSINNIVDATNYVMLNLGQPLHAFDADKLDGEIKSILVRSAHEGEEITTLTGDEYTLTPETLLITDAVSKVPIAIAGVKGGARAEVDESTKTIILESAHFDFSLVRKTAQRLRLSTDASQRFQNNPSPHLVGYALRDVTALILDIAGGALEGGVDVHEELPESEPVNVSISRINALLGTDLTGEEVSGILTRLGCTHTQTGEVFEIKAPFERTDIRIAEDVIEEVGRVHGYEHVESKQLPQLTKSPEVHKGFYFADLIRNMLVEAGYSEIYGYTFRNEGDTEAITALASDKNFLRTNLSDGIREYLTMNAHNTPLFGVDRIRLFEIGTVFPESGEHLSLAIGVSGKKTEKILAETKMLLEEKLGTKISENIVEGVLEIQFENLIESLEEGTKYQPYQKNKTIYKAFSAYPYVTRDIAFWVSGNVSEEKITEIIRSHAGDLLFRLDLFDQFEKESRTSYAFHLVFQSMERTLTDEEVGKIMDTVSKALEEEGYELR